MTEAPIEDDIHPNAETGRGAAPTERTRHDAAESIAGAERLVATAERLVAAAEQLVSAAAEGTQAELTRDVECGPLRREGDGTWWYHAECLGRDGQPTLACAAFASNVALVTLRLYRSLVACSASLRDLGQPDASEVLAKFDAWRITGQWPTLCDELRHVVRGDAP